MTERRTDRQSKDRKTDSDGDTERDREEKVTETEERETKRGMRGRQRDRRTQREGHTAGPGWGRQLPEPLSLELSMAGILRTVQTPMSDFKALVLTHSPSMH